MSTLQPAFKRQEAPIGFPIGWIVVALITVCLGIFSGVFLEEEGWIGLLVVGCVPAGILFLAHPILAFFVFIALIPVENTLMLGESLTLSRILGIVAFGTWFMQAVVEPRRLTRLFRSTVLPPALLLTLFAVASVLWAVSPMLSLGKIPTLLQLVLLTALALGTLESEKELEHTFGVLILSGLVAVFLTLWQAQDEAIRRPGEDITGGVNATAETLVLLWPLAIALVRGSSSRLWRWLGGIYVVAGPLGVVFTFSRSSYIILAAALSWVLWQTFFRQRQKRVRIICALILIVTLLVAFVPWDLVSDRVATIGPYLGALFNEDAQIIGARVHHWLGAWAVFRDHPLLGCGYANFGLLFLKSYQFEVASADGSSKRYSTLRSPHSSHLGILADLGIFAGLIWIVFQMVVILRLFSACRRLRGHASPLQYYLAALLITTTLYFVYGLITVTHDQKLFWLILGISEFAWTRLNVSPFRVLIGRREVNN